MLEKFPLHVNKDQSKNDIFDKMILQEKEAFDFGFYWETLDQLLDQVTSECEEIREAAISGSKNHLEEEIGDLIHAAISLCIFCGFDPHKIASQAYNKFQKRFEKLVHLANADNHQTLRGQSLDVLLKYWEMSKEK